MTNGLLEFKSRSNSTRPMVKGKGGGEKEKKDSYTKWFKCKSQDDKGG